MPLQTLPADKSCGGPMATHSGRSEPPSRVVRAMGCSTPCRKTGCSRRNLAICAVACCCALSPCVAPVLSIPVRRTLPPLPQTRATPSPPARETVRLHGNRPPPALFASGAQPPSCAVHRVRSWRGVPPRWLCARSTASCSDLSAPSPFCRAWRQWPCRYAHWP